MAVQEVMDTDGPVVIAGYVSFRSSKRPGGPPGESEVLALNPQRRTKILERTGWSTLESGSLNLDVDQRSLDVLLERGPLFVEPAETVTYPPEYAHIPTLRKAYFYYRATARSKGKALDVLVRRAQVPGPIRVELFAPVSLKAFFDLKERDLVEVEIDVK